LASTGPPRNSVFLNADQPLGHRLSWTYSAAVFYDLAGYSGNGVDRLVQKLQQFPRGTQIVCPLALVEAERHRSEIDAIRQAAQAAGVVLRIKYP
jgi:hypothetical protein